MSTLPIIRAAGGLVFDSTSSRNLRLAVIERRVRGDLTFPKGKLELGETELDAAVREVREETELRCSTGTFLGRTRYRFRTGAIKTVAYWTMQVESGTPAPTDEVARIHWLTPDGAMGILSYDHDQCFLAAVRQSLR